jgi:Flp pilus assembly protein TadG
MSSVVVTPLRKLAARFVADRSGNIAVMFAIASVPLLILVGAAVDYSLATAARSAMQSAVDSAALMASKDYASGVIQASEIPAKVDTYMRALYTAKGVTDISVNATYTQRSSDGTSTVAVTATGKVPTSFMKFANIDNIPFKAASTSTWGATRLRVAMALDITGSMDSNGKLAAMKESAKKLIDILKASATTTGDVYISIIPFNQMVNVGTDKSSADWVDWHARLDNSWDRNYSSNDYGKCSDTSYITQATCTAANKTWTFLGSCNQGGYTTQATCVAAGKKWTEKRAYWQGCVTDRDLSHVSDYDTKNTTPTRSTPATLFVAKDYSACGASFLPMKSAYDSNESDNSTDENTLKGKINSLVANGATNQAIGMHWAWMALQLQSPPFYTIDKEANYKYNDVIILLSDGQNTRDYWYGDGQNYSSGVDGRQKMLCDTIKTPGNGSVSIYTIQVNTGNDPESAILKSCASSTSQFFQSKTTEQIKLAFQAIGSSLTQLRLQK